MESTLSIVVPCYNESSNLERLIAAFAEAVGARHDIELLLVDNGSRDATPERLVELLRRPENRFARSVRVDINQGYGFGIKFGLNNCTSQFIGWTHADLQTPPVDVLRGFDILRKLPSPETSVVRGLRRGRPRFDKLFTDAMGWLASTMLNSSLVDVNAQPKLFHRSLLSHFANAPDDFTLDLYLLYVANRLKLDIKTFDVRFEDRLSGTSKGGGSLAGKYKLSKRTFGQILRLRKALKQEQSGRQAIASDSSSMTRKVA